MEMKTIGIGIAALILGFLGGTMFSGNKQPTMNQEAFDTIIQTPESRDMMIESMMNDDASRTMIEEKVMKKDEESMMEESPTGAMEK